MVGSGSAGFGIILQCLPDFLGARERTANVGIVRAKIERDEPIAVGTVCLEIGPDLLSPLAKHLGALGAFNPDLIVDHEMTFLKAKSSPTDLNRPIISACAVSHPLARPPIVWT
jgi:hypothetical protein